MNRIEWLTSDNINSMLAFFKSEFSNKHKEFYDRKLALFASSLHRSNLPALTDWDKSHKILNSLLHIEKKVNNLDYDQDIINQSFDTDYSFIETALWSFGSLKSAADKLRDIVGDPFNLVSINTRKRCHKCNGELAFLRKKATAAMSICKSCNELGPFWHDVIKGDPPAWLTHQIKLLASAAYEELDTRECFNCAGRGGWWDNEVVDQWYTCNHCQSKGKVTIDRLNPESISILTDALKEEGIEGLEMPCLRNCFEIYGVRVYTESGRAYSSEAAKLCDCKHGKVYIESPVLTHLKTYPSHYRGCWAIDLLMGRGDLT